MYFKHKFFELYQADYSSIRKNGKSIHWNQFDELISTRKHYFSLIKRACDFQLLDEAFYNQAKSTIWKVPEIQKKMLVFKEQDYNEFVSKHKSLFFNYCISYIFRNGSIAKWRDKYYELVENLLNSSLPDNVLNFIIKSSRFSNGLNMVKAPIYLIGDEARETRFDNLSFQRNSFLAEDALTPPFHLYFLPSYNEMGMHQDVDISSLFRYVAECLIIVLVESLENN